MNILRHRTPHSSKLERWLGAEKIADMQRHMAGWYGPPIHIGDVPGNLWVSADGDFRGSFERGSFASALDALRDNLVAFWKRVERERAFSDALLGVGFTSISDALARASSGDGQFINQGPIAKNGATGVSTVANSLWRLGTSPQAGTTPSAAPGGNAPNSATAGAMPFNNPATGTLHLVGANFSASVVNNSLLLYDRIFHVAKTINSTAAEAVTGVPTRYQSVTATTPDYIGGNFLFIEVGATPLAAVAHNWTPCTYADQANAASTLPSVAGASAAIADRFDMPGSTWFCPLEAGDVGIKALTNIQCNALVTTGAINFVIGHPIDFMMFPIAGPLIPFDWLTNNLQAPRIFDNACLSLIEMPKPSSGACTYSGMIKATRAAP